MDLRTDAFDYTLPSELVAQEPEPRRDMSRLLVLDRASGAITHDRFLNLGSYLQGGDVVVANRSKVIPARIMASKKTGGAVELLLLHPLEDDRWRVLARPSRKLRAGMSLLVRDSCLSVTLEQRCDEGQWVVRFRGDGDVAGQLRRAGTVPLPPYIRSWTGPADRYQTVYADREGSVAAPTAGLHFSSDLLDRLQAMGAQMEYVTLHVGVGTFKPVSADRVSEHRMHPEWGEVSAEAATAINRARDSGHRVVAIGTTTTRLLESAWKDGQMETFSGETDRFIYPGYRFRAIDALVTNFHLPRSTLLMLVSAFAGHDLILRAYREAIHQRYRFYSFGDAMLIL